MSRELIAILRGIRPDQAVEIGEILIGHGIDRIEVPLKSPDPISSVKLLAKQFGDVALIGAGTVLSSQQVEAVAAVGGKLIVSPDCNPEVISATKSLGLQSYPGVATPSDALAALRHSADGLKFIPSFLIIQLLPNVSQGRVKAVKTKTKTQNDYLYVLKIRFL